MSDTNPAFAVAPRTKWRQSTNMLTLMPARSRVVTFGTPDAPHEQNADALSHLGVVESTAHPAQSEFGRLRSKSATQYSSLPSRSHVFFTSDVTPFSNAEIALEDQQITLPQHLFYVRAFFQRPYGAELAARIEALSDMAVVEEDQASPSPASVVNLIGFLESTPMDKPMLAMDPNGEIIAVWKHEGEGEFSVRFMSDGTVRFLMSKTNTRHPEGVTRIFGSTTSDELFARAGLADISWAFSG